MANDIEKPGSQTNGKSSAIWWVLGGFMVAGGALYLYLEATNPKIVPRRR